jgi:hypothetical protein
MMGWMLITSIRFILGFSLKTLVGLRWMPMMNMRQASELQELHLNCHYECAMDIKPGQISKVLSLLPTMICYLAQATLFLVCAIYLPLPLCIHGNSCLVG